MPDCLNQIFRISFFIQMLKFQIAKNRGIFMNTRSTTIVALIFIIFLLPVLCLASDSVRENAIKDDQRIAARNHVRNSFTDLTAQALSRYYGAHSPQGETDLISDQIQDLIDSGNLNQKTGLYLQVMLKAAKIKFDQGNDNTAVSHLQAFIHFVNKYVRDGQLSKEDGLELIENTQLLIEALQV